MGSGMGGRSLGCRWGSAIREGGCSGLGVLIWALLRLSSSTCSDHYYISVHGSCLTYFINPQRYLPTTQKKGIKESIAVMPGLVRISNRVFWVSGYGILYAEGARWEGGGV